MEEEPNFELFLNEVQEPPAKQARFASVSASDVEEMLAKPEGARKHQEGHSEVGHRF